jgi:hypothetical protein
MTTQSIKTQSHSRERAAAPKAAPAERLDATLQTAREGVRSGARILRRWSVAELIARAGGAPRAFA